MSSRALKEHTSVALLAEGVLNGNRLMLSRAISHVENQETDASALLTGL